MNQDHRHFAEKLEESGVVLDSELFEPEVLATSPYFVLRSKTLGHHGNGHS